jgi:peptidoglycan-N-acetylglucosamine deacetylase
MLCGTTRSATNLNQIGTAGRADGVITNGWGAQRKAGALSFTFDNLGEAAEIEFGEWPADKPIGEHYSARRVVPTLLSRLEGLRVTFFIEGWNAGVYPETLRSIDGAGHEVAMHGWRHEIWERQTEQRQRAVFMQALDAMRSLGLEPQGFRPPGGAGSAVLEELLRREGLTYVSDVGDHVEDHAGVVRLPFLWRGVDGVFLEPNLGKAAGVSEVGEGGVEALYASHRQAIATAKATGSHAVFVFHPFLLGKDPAHLEGLFSLIAEASSDPDLWVAPCRDVAQWVLSESAN